MARIHLPPVLLLACLVFAGIGYSSQDIVGSTCERCANPVLPYDFCVKTLSSDPRSGTADLVGLGVIAIEHLNNSVAGARSYAAGLLEKKWDQYTTQCLKDCMELYTDSATDMPGIEGEYKGGLYGDAQTHLSAVEDSSITCETQFMGQKPMTSENLEAKQSASLALAIINIIPK